MAKKVDRYSGMAKDPVYELHTFLVGLIITVGGIAAVFNIIMIIKSLYFD